MSQPYTMMGAARDEPKRPLLNELVGFLFFMCGIFSVIALLINQDPIYIATFFVSISLSNLLFVVKPFVNLPPNQKAARRCSFLSEESAVCFLTLILLGGYACFMLSGWPLMTIFILLVFSQYLFKLSAMFMEPMPEPSPMLDPAHANCKCGEDPGPEEDINPECQTCKEKESCEYCSNQKES